MSNEEYEIQFNKLNFKENDYLIIQANTTNVTNIPSALREIKNSDFVKYLYEEKNVKVFICGSDLKFQILRMEESDKLIMEVDVDNVNHEDIDGYLTKIYDTVVRNIDKNNIIIIPKKGNVVLKVKKGDANGS